MNNRAEWEPTEKQEKFVDGLLAGRNITEAAKAAGCSRSNWYASWRDDRDFRNYFDMRRYAENSIRLPSVDRAVFEKAMTGNIQAARLFYQRYDLQETEAPEPLNVKHNEYDDLTDEELDATLLKLAKEAEVAVYGIASGNGGSEGKAEVLSSTT